MTKEHDLDIMPLLRSPLPVAPFDDISEGPGLHVQVGEGSVELFPATRVARAELAGDRARMTGVNAVRLEDEVLSITGESEEYHTALRLDPTSLTFVKAHKRAPGESSVEAPPTVAAELEATPAGDVTERPPAEGLSEGPGGEEHERINLVGRIGYAPKFRETAKGTLVGQFALAVHAEPGETSWHSVVLFGARAEKLRESGLGKGDEVEVVGYPHEREKRNQKTGETKMVTEVYAAVVKKPKDKES